MSMKVLTKTEMWGCNRPFIIQSKTHDYNKSFLLIKKKQWCIPTNAICAGWFRCFPEWHPCSSGLAGISAVLFSLWQCLSGMPVDRLRQETVCVLEWWKWQCATIRWRDFCFTSFLLQLGQGIPRGPKPILITSFSLFVTCSLHFSFSMLSSPLMPSTV